MPKLQLWPKNAEEWRNTILSALILSNFAAALTAYLCAAYINAIQGTWKNRGSWRFNYDPIWSEAFEYASIFVALIVFLILFFSFVFFVVYRDKMAKWCFIFLFITLPLAILTLPYFARAREKPVIYIYPTTEENVNVKLQYNGQLTCTYPEYPDDGWSVIARPDGDLTDLRTGINHYCLYWEGVDNFNYNMDEGYVVKGEDTAQFLEFKLSLLGLNDREKNEFIIYWLPKMQKNPYNLVSFVSDQFVKQAQLEITPPPETLIRVFMVFKPINAEAKVKPQVLKPVTRRGFTVVEWGGSEL